ncbi:WAT1-related protein At3g28050-like [Cornus florida]|uniref:WAT1-related protein At3g28050-like n=1 Tax=Cornus florida TaxID=4283 RepID=UPI0028989D9B|nr:WAT1-related protein At3g28050-like [Cornus florida]
MWAAGIIVVLVITEFLEVGLNTLTKAAMSRGMSNFVFVVYSNALASCFLLPATFIFHRFRPWPQLTFSIICRIFLLSLLGFSVQTCVYIGIRYSSPTLASAMIDLTPAFTFILAIITRMEKLNLKAQSSQAKSIGTIISITGAFIVTFYKGQPIIFFRSASDLLHRPVLSSQSNWIAGGFLLAVASFFLALLYVVQTWIIRDYPSELMVTLIACAFVTIQSTIVALIAEREPSAWELRLDIELLTICYAAIAVVALRSVCHSWALRKKGPVFVTMFKPLGMVIAIVMGVTFLGDTLHIGSVIGATVIAVGFYSVMWGKAREEKTAEELENGICGRHSSSTKVPLLQNKSMDV